MTERSLLIAGLLIVLFQGVTNGFRVERTTRRPLW